MCALSPTSFQSMQIKMKLKVNVVTNDISHGHIYIKFWCPGAQCRIVMAANPLPLESHFKYKRSYTAVCFMIRATSSCCPALDIMDTLVTILALGRNLRKFGE